MRFINQKPDRLERLALGALPFVLLFIAYAVGSYLRRLENPSDKLLPSLEAMGDAFWRMAFVADRRSGDYLLWTDTAESLFRLSSGLGISLILAVAFGVAIGFVPRARAGLSPFVAAISLIPPITVLPILFIIFGLGEASKIALIVVGTAPVMARSLAQAVNEIPQEQIVTNEE